MNDELWIGRARQSLASANLLVGTDDDGACSRAYYAIFYAARAALIYEGFDEQAMGKTHSGMIGAFSQRLVKSGKLDVSTSRAFARVQSDRLIADYTGEGVSGEVALRAILAAEGFIDAVERYLRAL